MRDARCLSLDVPVLLTKSNPNFWATTQRYTVMQSDASIEAAYPAPGVESVWRRAQMEERLGCATRHYDPIW